MLRNVVESERTRDQFGWQERLHGRIDEAFITEGAAMNDGVETHILALLRYYLDLHFGRPPSIDDFNPGDDRLGVQDLVSYVDVSSEDPHLYACLNHQPSPFQGVGKELNGRRIVEHPLKANALSCLGDYRRCSRTAVPEFALIDQHMDNGRTGEARIAVRRTFYRLMLPLAGPGGGIDKIAYAFRRVRFSEPDVI